MEKKHLIKLCDGDIINYKNVYKIIYDDKKYSIINEKFLFEIEEDIEKTFKNINLSEDIFIQNITLLIRKKCKK